MDTALKAPNLPLEKKHSTMEKVPDLRSNDLLRIAVNINTGELCKKRKWPESHFRQLIDLLVSNYNNLHIYLVGSRSEATIVSSFFESLPNKKGVQVVAGKIDILEFSYLLTKMNFLILNDSGPLHIAETLNIPAICFFGPETPNLYGPLSENSVIIYKNLFCSPCLNTYNNKRNHCNDNQCLKLISVEEVYETVKAMFLKYSLDSFANE